MKQTRHRFGQTFLTHIKRIDSLCFVDNEQWKKKKIRNVLRRIQIAKLNPLKFTTVYNNNERKKKKKMELSLEVIDSEPIHFDNKNVLSGKRQTTIESWLTERFPCNRNDCTNYCEWQQFNQIGWMSHLMHTSTSRNQCLVCDCVFVQKKRIIQVRTMQPKLRVLFRFTEAYRKFKCGKNQFPYFSYSFTIGVGVCRLLLHYYKVGLSRAHCSQLSLSPSLLYPPERTFCKVTPIWFICFYIALANGSKRSLHTKKNYSTKYTNLFIRSHFQSELITSIHLHPLFVTHEIDIFSSVFISS